MGSEDLCDAQFVGHDSVEFFEAQIDHQGTYSLCLPWCHIRISWRKRCYKVFSL